MFCTNCGSKHDVQAAFCTTCGKQNAIKQPAQEVYYAPPAKHTNPKVARALVVLLTTVMLITMVLGWFTITPGRVTMQDITGEFGGAALGNSLSINLPIHSLAGATELVRAALDTAEYEIMRWGDMREMIEFQAITEPIRTVATIVTAIHIFVVVCIAMLLIFLFLLLIEQKWAVLVGQIGTALVALKALAFAVTITMLDNAIQQAISADGWYQAGDIITIRASIWVYGTFLLGITAFILLTARKRALIGRA